MISADDNPLVALLARGDAATLESLDEAVRAAELSLASRRAALAGFAGLGVMAAALVVLLLIGAFVLEPAWRPMLEAMGGEMPLPTRAALALLRVMKLVAPLLAVALIAVWGRRDRISRFLPGVRALEMAAALRSRLAGLEAGVESASGFSLQTLTGLDSYELLLSTQLLADEGAPAVLRMLAQEKEREGRVAAARVMTVLPVWQLFLGAFLICGFAITICLPIFSMSGSVK